MLDIQNISKTFEKGTVNEHVAINNLSLKLEDGEFVTVVGSNGAGKSTLFNAICGSFMVDEGHIFLDDMDITYKSEHSRAKMIGRVFQDPMKGTAPNMTIEENLALAYTRASKQSPFSRAITKKKIQFFRENLARYNMGIEDRMKTKIGLLSGGQRQRVALGRAIVKDQKVFLMDEPLSNLDAKLRVSMRNEISKLHRNLGSTTIYVTHDQVEAMTMADRIVIMKDGIVQQIGKPMELYEHPVNKFVAGFIGSPQMNFYNVKVDGNKISFTDGNSMVLNDEMADKLRNYKEVILGIRGEDIKFDPQNLDIFKENKQRAVIDNTEIMGNENNLYFEFGGSSSVARVSKYEVSDVGEEIEFVFVPHRMHFFDKVTEDAIVL